MERNKMVLISYDAKQLDYDNSIIDVEIKSLGQWWHHLKSVWIVKTDIDLEQITDRLKKYLNPNDNLLVIEVTENFNGWLPERAWQWIKSKFDSKMVAQ